MPFAVVGCSHCHEPWAVDLRYDTSSCPRCGTKAELARRTRLWQGDDARDAQRAAADLRAGDGHATVTALADDRHLPRYDSPVDAAAAKAAAVVNQSQRADIVAWWLTRLVGDAGHDDYVTAMERAGLQPDRAEKEITRMLATDVIYEPRAGTYRVLE